MHLLSVLQKTQRKIKKHKLVKPILYVGLHTSKYSLIEHSREGVCSLLSLLSLGDHNITIIATAFSIACPVTATLGIKVLSWIVWLRKLKMQ